MCKGDGCEAKNNCYRFTATPSMRQSYFMGIPIENEGCEFYINNKQLNNNIKKGAELFVKNYGDVLKKLSDE